MFYMKKLYYADKNAAQTKTKEYHYIINDPHLGIVWENTIIITQPR